MNETKGDIKMDDFKKMTKLAGMLQALAHEYGYETFRDAMTEACFMASEDTEDFEDKNLTQKYRYLGDCVIAAKDNEPMFSRSKIEE